jgi:2-amino-4-hydroxy-6-hydroxymethyldihydropteridine diphosphokinase
MSEVFVAIGGNVDPEKHLHCAARALRERFPRVRFSGCYRNPAFGFEGADFLNAVAGFHTTLSVQALLVELRAIETLCGRKPADPKWGPRAIDLDLLLFGQLAEQGQGYTLPRPDLTRRAYMLGPLAELAPRYRLPPAGPTVGELWERLRAADAAAAEGLRRIDLDLNAVATP